MNKGNIGKRSWSFSYNSFVKFHGKKNESQYIQMCGILRCIIKQLHCTCFHCHEFVHIWLIYSAGYSINQFKGDSNPIISMFYQKELYEP